MEQPDFVDIEGFGRSISENYIKKDLTNAQYLDFKVWVINKPVLPAYGKNFYLQSDYTEYKMTQTPNIQESQQPRTELTDAPIDAMDVDKHTDNKPINEPAGLEQSVDELGQSAATPDATDGGVDNLIDEDDVEIL